MTNDRRRRETVRACAISESPPAVSGLVSTLTAALMPARSGRAVGVVDLDAHGNALGHLDPVAGGVLGRDQREFRAGRRADAVDLRP